MHVLAPQSQRGDGQLWLIAFALSILANLILLFTFGLAALESTELRKKISATPSTPPRENIVQIMPIPAPAASSPAPAVPPEKRFARTSQDQSATPPKSTAFIGEQDTQATSDRRPLAEAPPLPSQAGITPRDELDIETTESTYQDGEIIPQTTASTTEPELPAPAQPPSQNPVPSPAQKTQPETAALPPPREHLLDGPNPVDVQVPRETAATDQIKPATAATKPTESLPPEPPPPTEAAVSKPKPTTDPAFSGNQRKTAVVGSISRTGRSALDVADTPLGRYQASISRAVEQEWQRNCVRHRDFITPGYLTVRFFVQTDGKVRSVQFVGDMETGEVQKGFTLNSIRDAEIPAMPKALRGEYDDDPLELIFRFYF